MGDEARRVEHDRAEKGYAGAVNLQTWPAPQRHSHVDGQKDGYHQQRRSLHSVLQAFLEMSENYWSGGLSTPTPLRWHGPFASTIGPEMGEGERKNAQFRLPVNARGTGGAVIASTRLADTGQRTLASSGSPLHALTDVTLTE